MSLLMAFSIGISPVFMNDYVEGIQRKKFTLSLIIFLKTITQNMKLIAECIGII